MVRSTLRRNRGLTLIEALIVVLVISILATFVIPRLMAVTRSARETTLRADLRLLRAAVEAFHADVGGFPVGLEQLMDGTYRKNPLPLQSNGTPGAPIGYRGPYLTTGDGQLPKDPMTRERTWGYDPASGLLWSHADGEALDGTPYADW